jgi:hypothetical protein
VASPPLVPRSFPCLDEFGQPSAVACPDWAFGSRLSSYPAEGDSPATASTRSIPIGITIGAGTVIPLST